MNSEISKTFWVSVGTIARPHGIDGAFVVRRRRPFRGRREALTVPLGQAFELETPIQLEGASSKTEILVNKVRYRDPLTLLALQSSLKSREALLAFRDAEVLAPSSSVFWVDDGDRLPGFEVRDVLSDDVLGRVVGVLDNGAQSVLCVEGEKQGMIPWVEALVPRVDFVRRCLWVQDLPGLFEE